MLLQLKYTKKKDLNIKLLQARKEVEELTTTINKG